MPVNRKLDLACRTLSPSLGRDKMPLSCIHPKWQKLGLSVPVLLLWLGDSLENVMFPFPYPFSSRALLSLAGWTMLSLSCLPSYGVVQATSLLTAARTAEGTEEWLDKEICLLLV